MKVFSHMAIQSRYPVSALLTLLFSESINSNHLSDILERFQDHLSKCAIDITEQQTVLLTRCRYLDETSAAVTKKMTQSLSHAVATAEKMGQGKARCYVLKSKGDEIYKKASDSKYAHSCSERAQQSKPTCKGKF